VRFSKAQLVLHLLKQQPQHSFNGQFPGQLG